MAAFGSPVFDSRMKYGLRGERPVRRDRPALDRALVVVGDAEEQLRRGGVAVVRRRCPRRRRGRRSRPRSSTASSRSAPPSARRRRTARGRQESRRRLDVVLVQRAVEHAQLVGHQDRVGRLVELGAERVGRRLAVEEAVARHRAVGLLLAQEQEVDGVAGRGQVAVGDQAGPGLVQVAGEDLAVGAEVGVRRVAGGDGLAPRRGDAGGDRAGEGLVLRGLERRSPKRSRANRLPAPARRSARRSTAAAC